jgi:transcription antitermination factor NusG
VALAAHGVRERRRLGLGQPRRPDGLRDGPQALRSEFIVRDVFGGRGFDVFVPCGTKTVRRNSHGKRQPKREVPFPIWPGFVLIDLGAPAPNWPWVLACPLVRDVMRLGGIPVRLPQAAVARLREMGAENLAKAMHRMMPTNREYDVGEEVEFLDGPMAGQTGRVTGIGLVRAQVLTWFFGTQMEVEVGLDRIGAVG